MAKSKGICGQLLQEMVVKKLYSEDADDKGNQAYVVKIGYEVEGADGMESRETCINVASNSPEAAKTYAMSVANDKMQLVNAKPLDVTLVPNSDEKLDDYGSGKDVRTDDTNPLAGMVPDSRVSAVLAKEASQPKRPLAK